jgi:putative DNA primase/helicase
MSHALKPVQLHAGPVEFNPTDVGNAQRFACDHHDVVRYAPGLGWLIWDGTRWAPDTTGEVERLARATVKATYAEAAKTADPDRRQALGRWAVKSEEISRIKAMLSLARSELALVVRDEALDRNLFALNTLSGIVELGTGKLRDHDPAAVMTKLAPAFYRPDAACPLWLTFLNRIMGSNLDLIDFLQRAAGYSLTGDTSERCFFLLYGTGANGKTTFLEVLRALVGDYGMQTPADTLMLKPTGGGIPNDLARLRGARFVTAVETGDGRRMAEPLVKMVTGGDTIAARFLHREFFEFKPAFKVWLATNHKPVIVGPDYAIWSRIRLVPFTVTIPAQEQDRHLREKLLEEGAGILAWAVEGCRQWREKGLGEPEAVKAANTAYREEMDPIRQFVDERCLVEAGLRERTGVLYAAFREWCEKNGRHVTNSMTFSLRLQERGLVAGRDRRSRFFEGIALNAEEP